MMTDPEGKPITAIIYHNNRPFSVFSGDNRYRHEHDFEWCEADDICVHHESGMGPGGPYISAYCRRGSHHGVKIWVRPGTRLCDNTLESRLIPICRRRLARIGYRLVRSPILLESSWGSFLNPFEWAQEGSAEYCKACDSWRHVDSDNPCEHLSWCEECAAFRGPGATDSCECVQNGDYPTAVRVSETPDPVSGSESSAEGEG